MQEIKYYANIEMKSSGFFLSIVEKLKQIFDINISNIKTINSETNNYSFDIEINTRVNARLNKYQIKNELFGNILRTIFFEKLTFIDIKEEAEIYDWQ